jgi:hypothetical protein
VPFTPSHVAAILPLTKTPLLPAALVVGSMVPDLFFYLPVDVPRALTHSVAGWLTVDLALGLALYILWEFFLRRPLTDFAPLWVRGRLSGIVRNGVAPRAKGSWRVVVLAAASVLVGALTHLVWDSFTHPGFVVSQLPWLAAQHGHWYGYEWAQNASSAIGGAVLVLWIFAWVRRTPRLDQAEIVAGRLSARQRGLAWIAVCGVGFAVALFVWVRGIATRGQGAFDGSLLFDVATRGIGIAGLVALIGAIAWWVVEWSRVKAETRSE